MSKLTKLLEYTCAGNSEKSSLLNQPSFMNTFNESEKQLVQGETTQANYLVQREVLNAIVVGAKSRESARNIVPLINTKSNTCRVPYGASPSGQYANFVAEGAAIPTDAITYSKTDITAQKAAVRPMVTNELIEDAHFDVIELELKKAGAKLENKLNQEVITILLDGVSGPSNVDPNGSHIGMYDLGLAKGRVDDFGWMADSVLLEPIGCGYMMDETNIGDILFGDDNVLGLKAQVLSAKTDGTGTAYWDDTDSTNHYQGLVFDSYNFAVIAMREDINIKKFDDPIHDLLHLVAKMRFGVGVLNADAGCRVLSK